MEDLLKYIIPEAIKEDSEEAVFLKYLFERARRIDAVQILEKNKNDMIRSNYIEPLDLSNFYMPNAELDDRFCGEGYGPNPLLDLILESTGCEWKAIDYNRCLADIDHIDYLTSCTGLSDASREMIKDDYISFYGAMVERELDLSKGFITDDIRSSYESEIILLYVLVVEITSGNADFTLNALGFDKDESGKYFYAVSYDMECFDYILNYTLDLSELMEAIEMDREVNHCTHKANLSKYNDVINSIADGEAPNLIIERIWNTKIAREEIIL